MKTWQERVFDEIRRLDAVNASMLEIVNQAGGPAGPLSEARGKVCDAIVILVKLDKDERAQTEAAARAQVIADGGIPESKLSKPKRGGKKE